MIRALPLACLVVALLHGCIPGGGPDGMDPPPSGTTVTVSLTGDATPTAPAFAVRWVVTQPYISTLGNELVVTVTASPSSDGSYILTLPDPPAEVQALYPDKYRAAANLVVLDADGVIVGGALSSFLFHSEPLAADQVTGPDDKLTFTIGGTIAAGYNVVSASYFNGYWDYGDVLDPTDIIALTTVAGFNPNDLPHAEALIY